MSKEGSCYNFVKLQIKIESIIVISIKYSS